MRRNPVRPLPLPPSGHCTGVREVKATRPRGGHSTRAASRRRPRRSRRSSGSSSLGSASASSSGTRTISVPRSATILPKSPSVDRVDRLDAEARAEHAVVGQRRAAALDVAEDRHARLVAGALLDRLLERHRDAAQAHVAERVGGAAELGDDVAVRGRRALGDDDDRERRRPWWRRWMSRQTSSMSNGRSGTRITSAPPAMPGVGGDPARVAAHHLDDDHAVVRLGRGVQAVDRVGGDLHRGLEAEREVGAREVVVDRLRDADDVDPLVDQPARDAQRVLAADRDQRVELARLRSSRAPGRRRRRP